MAVAATRTSSLLERRFRLSERGSTPRTEALGGLSTFLTMSYILFVNPAILSAAGVPLTGVIVATALSAAIATAAMGVYANLPFALAPGLGLNAVVAFEIVLGRNLDWPVGMACIVLEGLLALVLVLAGLREAVVRAVPNSLKLSIGVGIGLFITLVGLRQGGIVVNNPATGIALADLSAGPPLIALAGILASVVLVVRGVRGALLAGIAVSAGLGLIFGVLDAPGKVAEWPGSAGFSTIGDGLSPSALEAALTLALVPTIFALFMTDFFDTVGTAMAVGTAGNLVDEDGEMPGLRRMLIVDSGAAALGGAMGASSVTTYVESGAGVSEGARTGLASLVTAALFLIAIPFVPLIAVVGQQVPYADKTFITPAVAPALVLVGYLMMRLVGAIDWGDPVSALPAFLIIAGVPLTFSIAAGIGLGVIGYVLAMVATRRAGRVHPVMWILVPLFLAYFADDWLAAHVF
ncbi:MAG: adenine/guanine/hypoxanthine permease [Solirubrobacteraceae bacterium]|jgi:AGZA family xanthine/uracil permease-like MFS transporter|nr:adenine/guanine/hypoxanthine permease [Solirubrobacteraceae bacterium]